MNRFHCAPRFIVHTLDDACAVLAAAQACDEPVVFQNCPETFRALGPAWFSELARAAARRFPDVDHKAMLACDDAPAFILAALRMGITTFLALPESAAASRVLASLQAADALVLQPQKAFDLLECHHPLSACIEQINTHRRKTTKS